MSSERGPILRHAGTVLVGQLATMAFGVTDAIVAGRYSDTALAALSVGSAIFVSVFVSLAGAVQALLPVWAELHGAGRHSEVGRSVRQALYLCAGATVLGMAVLLRPAALLEWAQVPGPMRDEVGRYLGVAALALPASLLFRLFSTLSQSLGRPRLVTWLQLLSLALKLPLSVGLAFGVGGLPALGLPGCAWATVIVNWLLLVCAAVLLRGSPVFERHAVWRRPERPDARALARFARLGIPAGLAVLVEVTSFTLMALFIARLGTAASAAHQIAASLTAVAYMIPLSLSIAASARLSYWMGARDEARARAVVRQALQITLAAALVAVCAMVGLRQTLAGLYSKEPAVVQMAATLLVATAGYHLADALQTLCIFLLRCFRITVAPLVLYGTLLWGLGLGGSYALAYAGLGPFGPMRSPLAFWLMSAVALWITAALFLGLLLRTVRQRLRPATAAAKPAAPG